MTSPSKHKDTVFFSASFPRETSTTTDGMTGERSLSFSFFLVAVSVFLSRRAVAAIAHQRARHSTATRSVPRVCGAVVHIFRLHAAWIRACLDLTFCGVDSLCAHATLDHPPIRWERASPPRRLPVVVVRSRGWFVVSAIVIQDASRGGGVAVANGGFLCAHRVHPRALVRERREVEMLSPGPKRCPLVQLLVNQSLDRYTPSRLTGASVGFP